MERNQLEKLLHGIAIKYVLDARDGLKRNDHMNLLQGDVSRISDEFIGLKVDRFVEECVKEEMIGSSAGDLIRHVSTIAKQRYSDAEDPVTAAIVVDYVNFVGTRNGIDVAMYTSDLLGIGSTEAITELFHKLWGQCAGGVYDKPLWMRLQQHLEAREKKT